MRQGGGEPSAVTRCPSFGDGLVEQWPCCTFEQLSPLGLRGLNERGLEELPDDAEGELALHLGRP
jgi:hypothetical protein